jgi:hypothetical protein
LLEEAVPERVAPAVFGILKRREFPREETVRFLLGRYSKYAEHLRKPFFVALVVFYSHRAPCGCNVWHIFLSILLDRRPCSTKF